MEFQVLWFILWGILWAVFFTVSGFDLGAGMLQAFLGRNEAEKKSIIRSIGPFWNGNEVWLITAGGATFAAFPTTYALMFSYLYTALLLLLFSLIVRGVAVEFRNKIDSPSWKKAWGFALSISSFLIALLFGVAFGNIFRGLPMDVNGYHGSLIGLLNPYGLLTGLLFVLAFMVHGGLWLSTKIEGELSERASVFSGRAWYALLIVAVAFLAYSAVETKLYYNYLAHPVLVIAPSIAVIALLGVKIFILKRKNLSAFFSSFTTILMVVATGVIGLFPNLIPSSLDTAFSLTAFNSSSSLYTLKIMTVVALIFVPIVIAYQIWMFRIFREKHNPADELSDGETY